MKWPAFLLVYLAPIFTLLGYHYGSWVYALTFGITFGLVPLLDDLWGDDWRNPDPQEESILRQNSTFSWALYVFVPIQLALMIWSCYVAKSPTLGLDHWVGLLFMIGILNGGFSINAAHELGHRHRKHEQWLAKLLLFRVAYLHFHIEHLWGHHPRMATPEDPATARLGESIYRFYFRSIPGEFLSAWRLETERLKQKQIAFWSWHNQMLWAIGCPLLFSSILWGVWGWRSALFYALQSLLAILVLETVNYLEHYGLERQKLASGRYEKIGLQHSWNSSRRLTNYFLLMLQRHSDHHMHAQRPYQILRAYPQAPQLPSGYSRMLILVMIPPLWRRIMDPLALAVKNQSLSKASQTDADLTG